MKLNAAAEMMPLSTVAFGGIHPFAPVEQAAGYRELFRQLGTWLAEITGFAAVSFMPNAGAQGEYAGMLVIREFHEQRGEGHRERVPHPGVRARHQPRERRHGRHAGGRREAATTTATSTSRTSARRPRSTPISSRRSW